jgi:glycosyltransferase involved in cell wall biosynthesis
MRPALFHPWIYLRGGIERTLLELVTRSRHDWQIYTGRYLPDETFEEYRDLDVIEIGQLSVTRKVLPVARACLQLLRVRPEWSRHDALMVSCDGIGNLLTFGAGSIPQLCLCHTPLRVAYDATTIEHWRRSVRPSVPTRAAVRLFTYADRLAWRSYQRVFCVSDEVRRRLRQHNLVPEGRLEVLHPGVDINRFAPTGRREPFFLIPGRIMWTKNVELGIAAFLRFKDELAEGSAEHLRLVIAGAVDEKSRGYYRSLRASVAGRPDVEFVESPSDTVMLDLYDRCLATLFTPLNEDWGLVPLESMAFGKPVVAVNRGGPAESIIEGQTGFLRPATPSAFGEVMARLAAAAAMLDEMAPKARAQVERFHWSTFVDRLDDYLDTVGEARSRRPAGARR